LAELTGSRRLRSICQWRTRPPSTKIAKIKNVKCALENASAALCAIDTLIQLVCSGLINVICS
jgi:hypothetical protein